MNINQYTDSMQQTWTKYPFKKAESFFPETSAKKSSLGLPAQQSIDNKGDARGRDCLLASLNGK